MGSCKIVKITNDFDLFFLKVNDYSLFDDLIKLALMYRYTFTKDEMLKFIDSYRNMRELSEIQAELLDDLENRVFGYCSLGAYIGVLFLSSTVED